MVVEEKAEERKRGVEIYTGGVCLRERRPMTDSHRPRHFTQYQLE
jgi:hypothetical protein